MDSRAHPGSNVTGVYKKLYVAQSLKVMAHAVPAAAEMTPAAGASRLELHAVWI
jgi:hypothetical protein